MYFFIVSRIVVIVIARLAISPVISVLLPTRRKVVASRHLVCGNCRSWIQFESSGCGRTWADTRGESFAVTCKGCTEVTALEREVEGLRQMVEDMMDKVAGLRFEDKAAETEGR